MSEPIQAVRKSFDKEVQERCEAFARDMLKLVPELETITIVPSFLPEQQHLPSGYIVGRDGLPSTPGAVMRISMQLHLALKTMMERSIAVMRGIDDRMAQQAKEITERGAELAAIERRIAEHTQPKPAGAGGGDTPNGPRPGGN